MASNKQDVFHTKVINGRTFEGRMSGDGPYIRLLDKVVRDYGRGVALGSPIFIDLDEAGDWAVFKYGHGEHRFSMPGFSEDDIQTLAGEFGIDVFLRYDAPEFFETPAGRSLARWVAEHPRIARNYAHLDSYIPRWWERAKEMNAKVSRAA